MEGQKQARHFKEKRGPNFGQLVLGQTFGPTLGHAQLGNWLWTPYMGKKVQFPGGDPNTTGALVTYRGLNQKGISNSGHNTTKFSLREETGDIARNSEPKIPNTTLCLQEYCAPKSHQILENFTKNLGSHSTTL